MTDTPGLEYETFLSIEELVALLKNADNAYYNGDGESFLSDSEYDNTRRHALSLAPHNEYFTGVGSTVRGGKVDLPYQMGSLDQVYEGELLDWIGNWRLQQEDLTITDKLDGISAMVVYNDDGELQIAYSRGNGVQGADITRHLYQMPSVPDRAAPGIVIRGEVIIRNSYWPIVRGMVKTRGGEDYKNSRNCVAGLMNASSNVETVYEFIDFVAYNVVTGIEDNDKDQQLSALVELGFRTAYWTQLQGKEISDSVLTDHLINRKKLTAYEIDGIVIDVNETTKRKEMNPTRDTLNPAYSVKYKITDESNIAQAKVVDVEWNVSKHGYLKPRVQIEPTELVGVTIQHATGFNAAFIVDNGIGPGAVIEITRSGDVIPFIRKIIEPTQASVPPGEWEWTTNLSGDNVDAVLLDYEDHEDVIVNRLVDFFTKLDTPHLKKGNIIKLVDGGFNTAASIIKMSEAEMENTLGANGVKTFNGLHEKLKSIPFNIIAGAVSNTRGIGTRRVKKAEQALGMELVTSGTLLPCDLVNVVGFDTKTAERTALVINETLIFIENLNEYITIQQKTTTNNILAGQKIVFTGFRDNELQAKVEEMGGDMQSAVSGKTTMLVTTNPDGTTGKLKKARDLGVEIVGVDQFRAIVG